MTDSFTYQGNELVLFQHAKNWKKYFSAEIRPFIKGNVLETGAGIGSTTLVVNDGSAGSWLLVEPDPEMSSLLEKKIQQKKLPVNCRLQTGTIETITGTFDTIIYIDVLEHIKNDSAEMKKAATLLQAGGHLIVLSPAFPHLYSPFDKAIGHYRRYNKRMLGNITPPELKMVHIKYYDSMGYFAAIMNKVLLRQKYPAAGQVSFWDNWLVPVSKVTDKIFFHRFGKSIIAVWRKPAN